MPAVTANAPIQSCFPLAFGAMKSARQKSGRSTGLSTCWRRKCRVVAPCSRLQHDVVADAVRRPQAEHRLRRQPFLRDDAIEHLRAHRETTRVACLPTTASVRIAGYLPASSQAWKNGVQSMQFDQFRQRVVVEHGDAGLVRRRRRVVVPAAVEALRARLLQRHQPLGVAAVAGGVRGSRRSRQSLAATKFARSSFEISDCATPTAREASFTQTVGDL